MNLQKNSHNIQKELFAEFNRIYKSFKDDKLNVGLVNIPIGLSKDELANISYSYYRIMFFRLLFIKILYVWDLLPLDPINLIFKSTSKNMYHSLIKNFFSNTLQELKNQNNTELITKLRENPNISCGIVNSIEIELKYLDIELSPNVYIDIWNLLENIYENKFVEPSVLGYIFERTLEIGFTDRKTSGSYYTDESITRYISKKSLETVIKIKLNTNRKFDENKDENSAFLDKKWNEDELTKLQRILNNLRICDNACGSGAFLEEIGKLLVQYYQLAYSNSDLKPFSDLFSLKKHILNHNLYGVDIIKSASDICELRMLLWLYKPEKGFIPLEEHINQFSKIKHNIKTGNSLIGLYSIDQIKESNIEFENKDDYDGIQNQLTKQLSKEFDFEKIKKIKPFHWVLDFKNVMVNGGFDLIIGNPPYVRQEEVKHLTDNVGIPFKSLLKEIYGKDFEVVSGYDLAIYFIFRSFQLLKGNGVQSYLISSKWLRAKYGTTVRKFLKDNTRLTRLIDLTGISLFEGVNIDTLIFEIIKTKTAINQSSFFYNKPQSVLSIENDGYHVQQKSLSSVIWNFLSLETIEIWDYIQKNSIHLDKIISKSYFGVKTGYNKAFTINNKTKSRFSKEMKEHEIVERFKPLITGKEIENYRINWKKNWLIYIPKGFSKTSIDSRTDRNLSAESWFKKTYSEIHKHFTKFQINQDEDRGFKKRRKGLLERDDQGDFWWELRECDYYDKIEGPKIIWQRITKNPSFVLDQHKLCPLDSLAFISGKSVELKKLLVILNSNMIRNFYISNFVHQYGNSGFLLSNQYVEKIPIPDDFNIDSLEIFGEYLIFLNNVAAESQLNIHVDYFYLILNAIVYEIYFKNTFIEESIYSEKNLALLEQISKLIQIIKFDEWDYLHWKMTYNEAITNNERKEYENINNSITTIVNSFIISLKSSNDIAILLSRIYAHPWVKVLES